MTVIITSKQSLIDIALQNTGSAQNAFLIAKENSLAVTDYLVPGYELVIPEGIPFNREILNFYQTKKVKPATSLDVDDIKIQPLTGIGYWVIGETFEVQ